MKQSSISLVGSVLAFFLFSGPIDAEMILGRVVDQSGKPIEGVMVSAIDAEYRKWTSASTPKDGSFEISGLRNVDHSIRTRLMGLADEWSSGVAAGTHDMVIQTRLTVGDELEAQRPANSAFRACLPSTILATN